MLPSSVGWAADKRWARWLNRLAHVGFANDTCDSTERVALAFGRWQPLHLLY